MKKPLPAYANRGFSFLSLFIPPHIETPAGLSGSILDEANIGFALNSVKVK
jgi:hypothetical protein